jgi:hypothetical protein
MPENNRNETPFFDAPVQKPDSLIKCLYRRYLEILQTAALDSLNITAVYWISRVL